MKTVNAIKKLEKAGFTISKNEYVSSQINATMGEYRISFHDQDGNAICIWSDDKCARDTRDVITDYFPETYHNNITRAINFVKRMIERK